jgi:acyl-CoA synthetase (AMP-forming)/AMP-acid ligase II
MSKPASAEPATRPDAAMVTAESFVGAGPPNAAGAGGSILDVVRRHAADRPQSPAFVVAESEPFTYRALTECIDRVAVRLREAGLGRDARIAVALPSGPKAALAIVAVVCAAVAVPIDVNLTAPEIAERLAMLRVDAVLVPREGASATRDIARQNGLPVIEIAASPAGGLGLDISIARIGPAAAGEPPDAESVAFILQTSGTTATPKLIPFRHRNMLAAAARVRSWFGLVPEDRCLCVSPVHYAHGLHVMVFAPLVSGGSIAFPSDASAPDVVDCLATLKPTWYSAGPTLHRYVFDKIKHRPDARSIHGLRFVVSGGAPLAPDVREGLAAALGVPVLEHYGSSEAAQISSNVPPPGPYKAGTCGIPAAGTLMIAGRDGRAAGAGEHGEIWLRGPSVISGYLDAPELDRESFVSGWFRTGDIGSLDAEGFLTLHGRVKELINRGGEKVSPAEIDEALLRHPGVAEAAAFAVPHPRLGEDVAAAVVLEKGAAVTPLELRKFLAARLASFKIPRRIVVLDRLPKGATGKVQRQRLAETVK